MQAIAGLVVAGLLFASGSVAAGQFHHCDDGRGGRSYQTLPCSRTQTTLATHRYDEPPAAAAPVARGGRSRSARTETRPSRAAPAGTRRRHERAAQPLAYACSVAGRQWVQVEPCAAPAPRRRVTDRRTAAASPPVQRALSRTEVCLRVREGTTAAAPGERQARSAYRRNLLRERGRC